jgi:hypothetical protein
VACIHGGGWGAAIYWCGFVGRSSRVNTWLQYLSYTM